MQATVFDPSPPRWPPGWWALAPVLVMAAGVLSGAVTAPIGVLLLGALATILTLGAMPRARPRTTALVCRPGAVRLGKRGPWLRARTITGATTARHEGRISLVLEQAQRKQRPLVLSLANERELHLVCDSLGIGHHGFGVVDAIATVPAAAPMRILLSAVSLGLVFLAPFVGEWGVEELVALFMMAAFGSTAFAGLLAAAERAGVRPIIRLTSQGVFVPNLIAGSTFIPFLAIERVDRLRNALSLTVTQNGKPSLTLVPVRTTRWAREGLSEPMLDHLVAQIRAAAERAHGRFVLKDEPSSAVEVLRRQPHEPLRAWFSRLDTLGTAAAGGYRSTVLESADLWKLLDDPDAEPDLRAAAARVLSRQSPDRLRARVADVLEVVRDDRTRTRIAASMDDAVLAREEALDEREAAEHARDEAAKRSRRA